MTPRHYKFKSGRELIIGSKTLVMGILNVTPDSFSDGGAYVDADAAIRHVKAMIDNGADIIDIGAESTRPGFEPISATEEIARLEPILRSISDCTVPISIDTYKSETAAAAIDLGADFINDIHGLHDRSMAEIAARFDVPIIAMHDRRVDTRSVDVVDDVIHFIRQTINRAEEVGLDTDKLIFDPGIGFGKSQRENVEVLRRLDELKCVDDVEYPLLLGVSRKSVIGHITGLPIDQRDEVTGALCVVGMMNGIDIVRVHNVQMISRMIRAVDAIFSYGG